MELSQIPQNERWNVIQSILNENFSKISSAMGNENASGGGVKPLSQAEYDALVKAQLVSPVTIYLVAVDDIPIALYIGYILIAKREEGAQGFAYSFPIIF